MFAEYILNVYLPNKQTNASIKQTKHKKKRDRQNTEFINSNLRRKLMTLKMNI
jgi:phospholipase/lecithinase/hemolysin